MSNFFDDTVACPKWTRDYSELTKKEKEDE
jgi:hypothetical protein